MKKTVLLFLIIISIISCETEDDTKFYAFSNDDYNFIPTVYENNEDEILIFKNQFNEEVKIQIKTFATDKKSNGGISFTQDYSEFYFTEQIIIWLDLVNINFPNFGEGYCDQLHIIIEKKSNGTTETKLKVPSYTDHCSIWSLISYSPYNDLGNLSIGNENYNKVKVFETDTNFYLFDNSAINKLYYDFEKGIIGFDDTTNNINYRIVN